MEIDKYGTPTGKYNTIEDVLNWMHTGSWFGWSDPENKIYENIVLFDKSKSIPTEKELTDALTKQRADFDAVEYQRKREREYPMLESLVVALAEKAEGDSTMWDDLTAKRAAVKTKWPKDNSGPVE